MPPTSGISVPWGPEKWLSMAGDPDAGTDVKCQSLVGFTAISLDANVHLLFPKQLELLLLYDFCDKCKTELRTHLSSDTQHTPLCTSRTRP